MDHKIFLQRLKELARVEFYVEPSTRDKSRVKNPTWPVRVREIISTPQVCEDCGLVCVERRVEIKKCFHPIVHWRRTCNTCKLSMDPETKKFTVDTKTSYNFFKLYYSKIKTKISKSNK